MRLNSNSSSISDLGGNSDSLLIERCQRGDRVAFDLLVRKYERKAYQYAFRLCGSNPDDASDIVAEAFLRVLNNMKSFRREAAFLTWLYRILTNVYLDFRKRERIRTHDSLDQTLALNEGEVEKQFIDFSANPQADVEQGERQHALQGAIDQLPDYQRAMVLMYHVEGLAYEEIAEAMNLPLGTVKSRLNRARLALKELLTAQKELFGF